MVSNLGFRAVSEPDSCGADFLPQLLAGNLVADEIICTLEEEVEAVPLLVLLEMPPLPSGAFSDHAVPASH